jgi:hypothetical protein
MAAQIVVALSNAAAAAAAVALPKDDLPKPNVDLKKDKEKVVIKAPTNSLNLLQKLPD